MTVRVVALWGALLLATPAQAGKPFDIHGLIVGNEGARFVKGVPTLDLQQSRGAIEIRSLGFYNNHPMFAIAFYNAGPEPVNVGLEDIHAAANGTGLRVFSVEELEHQAKHKAWWSKFAIAMLGGISAGLASSQRETYHSSISGPYGTYTVNASYPSLAGELAAERISRDTGWGLAAIQYQLDRTIEMINDHVVQRTTVDPGASYAGLIIMDKLKQGDPPFEMHLDVDWNGERYPFTYVMQRPGRALPERYNNLLAERSKPRALNAMFGAGVGQGEGAAKSGYIPPNRIEGTIFLGAGLMKIPAKTASGYCLKAPDNYIGSGASNSPAITGGLPRCLDDFGRVEVHKDSAFKRYKD